MTKYDRKYMTEQILIKFVYPNLLLSLVEKTMKKDIGTTVDKRIQEFVSLSTC